eukprot:SAG11_NODE_1533_length_4732_cov_3.368012_2_plen_164_part_00
METGGQRRRNQSRITAVLSPFASTDLKSCPCSQVSFISPLIVLSSRVEHTNQLQTKILREYSSESHDSNDDQSNQRDPSRRFFDETSCAIDGARRACEQTSVYQTQREGLSSREWRTSGPHSSLLKIFSLQQFYIKTRKYSTTQARVDIQSDCLATPALFHNS